MKLLKQQTVKLLGITTDDKLRFDEHISNPSKRASIQLNALKHIKIYIENMEMETSAVLSTLILTLVLYFGTYLWQIREQNWKKTMRKNMRKEIN